MKHLKKLFLLTFVVLTGFACSSDDDNSSTTEENKAKIIGTWLWTSSTVNGVDDPLIDCDTMFTQTYTTNQLTETDFFGIDCTESESFTINYSISGNTISNDNDGDSVEITTLNSTTLTLKDTEDGEVYTETYTKQ